MTITIHNGPYSSSPTVSVGSSPTISLGNYSSQSGAQSLNNALNKVLMSNGNTNNLTFQSTQDMFNGYLSVIDNPNIKKYQMIESNEDLLILSCVWYRLRDNKPYGVGIHNLFDTTLFSNIQDVDRLLAASIRDYYSKKIMMMKLQGSPLTKFREDLNKFIHGDGRHFEEKICGLVYKLPEFYAYDTKFDLIVQECDKTVNEFNFRDNYKTHYLEHIGTLYPSHKRYKAIEYWFKNENNQLVRTSFEPRNPLLKVWEHIIKDGVKLKALYYSKNRDNIGYFDALKFEIA